MSGGVHSVHLNDVNQLAPLVWTHCDHHSDMVLFTQTCFDAQTGPSSWSDRYAQEILELTAPMPTEPMKSVW